MVKSYKGFNTGMKCRGFQFEVGKSYTHGGDVKACESGFHACEYPLDVFNYYAPASSRFAEVEQDGRISRKGDDTKIASQQIIISAEISIAGLIKASIDYTMSRVKSVDLESSASNTGDQGAASNTGSRGAASNTGDQGAASNTGNWGAASNTGDQGAASNTGNWGAASNTGDQGAASNTGSRGAASNTGNWGVAASFGYDSKAKSSVNGAIVCIHRNDDGEIIHIRASKVGDNGVKPDTWYTLDVSGGFVEVTE